MTDEEMQILLTLLRSRLYISEACGCEFNNTVLTDFLSECRYDVDEATYLALMKRAENDQITLPDGTVLPSQRSYWLSLARHYRPNKCRSLCRADEPQKGNINE